MKPGIPESLRGKNSLTVPEIAEELSIVLCKSVPSCRRRIYRAIDRGSIIAESVLPDKNSGRSTEYRIPPSELSKIYTAWR